MSENSLSLSACALFSKEQGVRSTSVEEKALVLVFTQKQGITIIEC